jgi:hypothetical protein
MIKLSGEIGTYLECIGLKEGNSKILDAMVLPGPRFTIETMEIEGIEYSSYQFLEHGVEFNFTDKLLKAIFIFMVANKEYDEYLLGDKLFDNIESYSTRTEVVESFGVPDIEKDKFVKYYLCKSKYIHFEFNSDGVLHLITLGYED